MPGQAEEVVAAVIVRRAETRAALGEFVNAKRPARAGGGVDAEQVKQIELGAEVIAEDMVVAERHAADWPGRIGHRALHEAGQEDRDIRNAQLNVFALEV